MEGFHKRYLASNKACQNGAQMAWNMDIEAIVPQHGIRYFKGKAMVRKFIDWVGGLACGVDIMSPSAYAVPK